MKYVEDILSFIHDIPDSNLRPSTHQLDAQTLSHKAI